MHDVIIIVLAFLAFFILGYKHGFADATSRVCGKGE